MEYTDSELKKLLADLVSFTEEQDMEDIDEEIIERLLDGLNDTEIVDYYDMESNYTDAEGDVTIVEGNDIDIEDNNTDTEDAIDSEFLVDLANNTSTEGPFDFETEEPFETEETFVTEEPFETEETFETEEPFGTEEPFSRPGNVTDNGNLPTTPFEITEEPISTSEPTTPAAELEPRVTHTPKTKDTPSSAPSLPPIETDYSFPGLPSVEEEAQKVYDSINWNYGLLYLVIAILGVCFMWKCCTSLRRRRQRRMLSAHADNVLGDMQMIPSDDFDHDNELI